MCPDPSPEVSASCLQYTDRKSMPGPCHWGLGEVQPKTVWSLTHSGREPQAQHPRYAPLGSAARTRTSGHLRKPSRGSPASLAWPVPWHAGAGPNPAPRLSPGRRQLPCWLTGRGRCSASGLLGTCLHAGCSERPLICGHGSPPAACWATRRPEAAGPVQPARGPLARPQPLGHTPRVYRSEIRLLGRRRAPNDKRAAQPGRRNVLLQARGGSPSPPPSPASQSDLGSTPSPRLGHLPQGHLQGTAPPATGEPAAPREAEVGCKGRPWCGLALHQQWDITTQNFSGAFSGGCQGRSKGKRQAEQPSTEPCERGGGGGPEAPTSPAPQVPGSGPSQPEWLSQG